MLVLLALYEKFHTVLYKRSTVKSYIEYCHKKNYTII